jgi:hypothetical protein
MNHSGNSDRGKYWGKEIVVEEGEHTKNKPCRKTGDSSRSSGDVDLLLWREVCSSLGVP